MIDPSYGVRCCADEAEFVPPKERSEGSCEALGWLNNEAGFRGSFAVCGESEVDDNQCVTTASSYTQATAICKAAKARLCTYGELVRGEERGTGCGHDNNRIWSSTPCTRCGDDAYFTHEWDGGSGKGIGKRGCVRQDMPDGGFVRCCADAEIAILPTVAPTTTATAPGTSFTFPPTDTVPTTTTTVTTTTTTTTTTVSATAGPLPAQSSAVYAFQGINPSDVTEQNFAM